MFRCYRLSYILPYGKSFQSLKKIKNHPFGALSKEVLFSFSDSGVRTTSLCRGRWIFCGLPQKRRRERYKNPKSQKEIYREFFSLSYAERSGSVPCIINFGFWDTKSNACKICGQKRRHFLMKCLLADAFSFCYLILRKFRKLLRFSLRFLRKRSLQLPVQEDS